MTTDDCHRRALDAYAQHRGHPFVPRTSPHDPASIGRIESLGLDRTYGESWCSPGLDFRTKSFITMSVLATLGCEDQLRIHIAAAHHIGITKDEIVDWLVHLNGYVGTPLTSVALRIAREVWSEQAEAKP